MASDTAKIASQWAQLADPGFAMTRDAEHVETVIIGGGPAGLTMSYSLSQLGLEHVILQRGRVGERWRSERWDSFHFQFPNWTIELPGFKYRCQDPDAGPTEDAAYLAEYIKTRGKQD